MQYSADQLKQAMRNAYNAGDEEAVMAIGQQLDAMEQAEPSPAPSVTPEPERPAYIAEDPTKDMSLTEQTLVGIGRGFTNVGNGVRDLYYRATDDKDALAKLNHEIENDREIWDNLKQHSTAASIGETVGEVAATAPLGGVAGAVGKGAVARVVGTSALPARAAASLGAGAADAGAASFVTQTGDLDERLEAAGEGAAMGALGTAAMGAAAATGRKFLNRGKNFTSEVASEADRLAEETGVPIFLDDVAENNLVRKTAGLTDNVPVVGTGAGRQRQHDAVEAFTEETVTSYGDSNSSQALEGLQGSIRDEFKRVRKEKNRLYDGYYETLAEFGDLPRDNTNGVLDQLIKGERASGSPDPQYLGMLERMRNAPEGDAKALLGMYNKTGDVAEKGFSGTGLGSHQGNQMSQLKEAMRLDAETFGKQVEDVMDGEVKVLGKLKEADAYYQKSFVPFKENKVLNTALKNNEPEAILKALNSQNGSGVRTSTFYNALNDEGKSRVQSAFLLDAFERSFRDDTFSPRTFRTNIGKLGRVHGILFKGDDKKLFQNLVDVLEHTKRSAESKGNPMNGSRAVFAGIVGTAGVAYDPSALATAGSASLAFKIVTQTKTGRRLFTASASRTKDTRRLDFMADYLGTAMVRAQALDASVED